MYEIVNLLILNVDDKTPVSKVFACSILTRAIKIRRLPSRRLRPHIVELDFV